jgi:FkbM family methyltransferase
MKKLLKKITSLIIFRKIVINPFEKVSYSQCGEDLIVKFIFDILKITNPTYLDIGAHHPHYLSNTALFYQNGSVGINIEPDPKLFELFKEIRVRDKNLNIGISDKEEVLDFYVISTPTLNTFSKKEAQNYEKEGNFKINEIIKIKVTHLDMVIKNFANGIFPQFLSIDAEGVDEMIINQIDFDSNYPIVICIETISFSTSGNGVKNEDLIQNIKSKGYLLYAYTNINTIFVRKKLWKR